MWIGNEESIVSLKEKKWEGMLVHSSPSKSRWTYSISVSLPPFKASPSTSYWFLFPPLTLTAFMAWTRRLARCLVYNPRLETARTSTCKFPMVSSLSDFTVWKFHDKIYPFLKALLLNPSPVVFSNQPWAWIESKISHSKTCGLVVSMSYNWHCVRANFLVLIPYCGYMRCDHRG